MESKKIIPLSAPCVSALKIVLEYGFLNLN